MTAAACMRVMVGFSAAQGTPSSMRLSSWPPRFRGPLWHALRPSPSLVQVWRFFWHFFCPLGGCLHPRAKTMIFYAQGRTRGVRCRKGAVQGPPVGALDGPIAGLVKGGILILTPGHVRGVGAGPHCDPRSGRRFEGPNKCKKAPNLNQRRGWPGGMTKEPWAPLGPWAEPRRQYIPLRCTKTHHNAHARRSGHAVAEPPMLAR